ncbi:MAG: flagellar basal body rod protein FlgB [Planctomycetaceae bacterium]
MLEFSKQIERLPRLMDAADLRHRVISQNLANVNTPGYHRLDVEFEKHLASEMAGSTSGSETDVKPEIVEDNSGSMRADGNNVDVDREIGQLNKNAILFQMYSQLLKSQFDTMKRAIEGP